ncbi:MAG TPA: hypothetical protein VJ826_16455 [Candidatus Polarisedimenticolaceae bacterium]|nr:hypothetical protein [Candidatus Polarisedimenticolaceae bacterium]
MPLVAPGGALNSNATALAKGGFNCGILTIDPPNGSGEPDGFAGVFFSEFMGLSSTDLSSGISIGTGQGLEPICETLAQQTFARLAGLGCAGGPLRVTESVGGNYTQKSWTIDVICVNDAHRVVGAVGSLLRSIANAPVAQQSIRRRSSRVIEPDEMDFLRYRWAPPVRNP